MSENIAIDPETISKFKTTYYENSEGTETDPGQDPENLGGVDLHDMAVSSFDKVLGAIHSHLKNYGGPGITDDETERKMISELSIIVGRRQVGDAVIQNTPEIMLGSIVAGLVATNYMAIKNAQAQATAPDPEPQDKDSQAQDNTNGPE